MARYTYRLTPSDGGYIASCAEIEAEGEGSTREAAVRSLRESICERMSSAEAVAPPSQTPHASVELIEASPAAEEPSPQGPGEA